MDTVHQEKIKPKLTRRVVIVRTVFWTLAFILAYKFFDPDLRFGPDFSLSSKIINPDEPGFNPEAFSFEDYDRYGDLFYTMDKMFPPGTPKSYVDHILTRQKAFLSVSNEVAPAGPPPEDRKRYAYRFQRLYRHAHFFCAFPQSDNFRAVYDRDNGFLTMFFNPGPKCPKFKTRGGLQ